MCCELRARLMAVRRDGREQEAAVEVLSSAKNYYTQSTVDVR
jgi:hypothetical protein